MVSGRRLLFGAWTLGVFAFGCGSTHADPTGMPAAGQSNDGGSGGTGGVGSSAAASAGTSAGTFGSGGSQFVSLNGGESAGAAGESNCELGEVSSTGTNQNLDLFGSIVYFADGIELPAGRYRITYLDGCMKYSAAQDWAVHAYAGAEPDGWWFVGKDQTQKVVVPPGTVGFLVSNGGFSTFEQCVAANLALPPLEFDFAGGKLGAWLQDYPYTDNLAGEDERNPKWKLTLLGDCELVHWPK